MAESPSTYPRDALACAAAEQLITGMCAGRIGVDGVGGSLAVPAQSQRGIDCPSRGRTSDCRALARAAAPETVDDGQSDSAYNSSSSESETAGLLNSDCGSAAKQSEFCRCKIECR